MTVEDCCIIGMQQQTHTVSKFCLRSNSGGSTSSSTSKMISVGVCVEKYQITEMCGTVLA